MPLKTKERTEARTGVARIKYEGKRDKTLVKRVEQLLGHGLRVHVKLCEFPATPSPTTRSVPLERFPFGLFRDDAYWRIGGRCVPTDKLRSTIRDFYKDDADVTVTF